NLPIARSTEAHPVVSDTQLRAILSPFLRIAASSSLLEMMQESATPEHREGLFEDKSVRPLPVSHFGQVDTVVVSVVPALNLHFAESVFGVGPDPPKSRTFGSIMQAGLAFACGFPCLPVFHSGFGHCLTRLVKPVRRPLPQVR